MISVFKVKRPADILKEYGPSVAYTVGGVRAVNDNNLHVMTGDFSDDAQTLKDKWGLTDMQYAAWAGSFRPLQDAAMDNLAALARKYVGLAVPVVEAMMTAAAMALCNQLFKMIQNLGHAEAVFLLEEVARQTDETIRIMKETNNV